MASSGIVYKADAAAGDIIIRLEALKALPIEGIISAFTQEEVRPHDNNEPSYTTFVLPPVAKGYVLFGVITPLRRVWGSPKYIRTISQTGGTSTEMSKTIKTRKVSDGEYVGPPEIIRIEID